MREKRNLSRMEAKQEKTIGEQAEALLVAERENSMADSLIGVKTPSNDRLSQPAETISAPLSVIQVTRFDASSKEPEIKSPIHLTNGLPVMKDKKVVNESKTHELPPIVPPRANLVRIIYIH